MTYAYELIQSVSIADTALFRGRISVYEKTQAGTYKPVGHEASILKRDRSDTAMDDAAQLAKRWIAENPDKKVIVKSGME